MDVHGDGTAQITGLPTSSVVLELRPSGRSGTVLWFDQAAPPAAATPLAVRGGRATAASLRFPGSPAEGEPGTAVGTETVAAEMETAVGTTTS